MEVNMSNVGARGTATELTGSQAAVQKKADAKVVKPNINSLKALQLIESQGEVVPVSEEQLVRAIERAIKAMQGSNTSLHFSIHETTKQIMVKVLDVESGEVIREIPPEKTLDFVAKLWEMAGILIDERR